MLLATVRLSKWLINRSGTNQELLSGRQKKPRPAAGASNHLAFALLRAAVGLFPVPAVSQPEHVPDAGRQSSAGRRASRLSAPGPWLTWPANHGVGNSRHWMRRGGLPTIKLKGLGPNPSYGLGLGKRSVETVTVRHGRSGQPLI